MFENTNKTPDENKAEIQAEQEKKTGGLYKNVNVSLKSANILVAAGIAILIFCVIFAVSHAGFTVTFDTNGGEYIESVKVMHGDVVPAPNTPAKEGYVFCGWFTDRDCTERWDIESDKATGSMTLYAKWEKLIN